MESRKRKMTDIVSPRTRRSIVGKNDSAKAGSEKKPKQGKSPGSMPWVKAGSLALLVLGIAGAGVAHVFFARATVFVWPVSRSLSLQETIQVQAGVSAVDVSKKVVSAKLIEEEKTATKLYPATGTSSKEAKAKGTVRVTNNQQKTQILIATTRFVSEDGKLFRSTERVSIPARSFTDVDVEAAEAGSEYNVGPSNFSLPGLAGFSSYTLVYGKSSQAMTGGTKTVFPVVTDQDIRKAKEDVEKEALQLAQKAVLNRSLMPFVVDARSLEVLVVDSFSSIQPGAELSQFNATAQAKAKALMFRFPDLQELAQEIFKERLADHEELHGASMVLTYTAKAFNPESLTLDMEIQGTITAYQATDLVEVKTAVQGAKRQDAELLLRAVPSIARFRVDVWPLWLFSLPANAQRITVNLVLD